jgi:hypothetical protein
MKSILCCAVLIHVVKVAVQFDKVYYGLGITLSHCILYSGLDRFNIYYNLHKETILEVDF